MFDIGRREWSGLQLEAFGGAEAGAAGAGIAGNFLGGGVDGFAGEEAEAVFGIGAGAGPLGAIKLGGGEKVEGVFGDAVFEGVEGDDGEAATGLEPAGGALEEFLEGAEFVVYGDAECLEDEGGGVAFAARRGMAGDEVREFQGAGDGAGDAGFGDDVGELPGAVFLAEITEDAGEFFDAGGVDDVGGRSTGGGVHAEVEGAIFLEGETAFGFVELMTGDAEVDQDTIEATDTDLGEDVGEVAEVAVEGAELVAEGSETLGGGLQGGVVLVHADDAGAEFEEGFGVTAAAEGAVEKKFSGAGFERSDDLIQKDRDMMEGRSSGAIGSGHEGGSFPWAMAEAAAAPWHEVFVDSGGSEPGPAAGLGEAGKKGAWVTEAEIREPLKKWRKVERVAKSCHFREESGSECSADYPNSTNSSIILIIWDSL